MYNLTLQVYGAGLWRDAMTLTFDDPANGFLGPCRFAYKASYVLNADADSRDQSVSARLPVDFETYALRQPRHSCMTSLLLAPPSVFSSLRSADKSRKASATMYTCWGAARLLLSEICGSRNRWAR